MYILETFSAFVFLHLCFFLCMLLCDCLCVFVVNFQKIIMQANGKYFILLSVCLSGKTRSERKRNRRDTDGLEFR